MSAKAEIGPGQDTYRRIRAGILAHTGKSFGAYVKEELGVLPTTARLACLGASQSREALELYEKLLKLARLK